jgi:hypothetical protein
MTRTETQKLTVLHMLKGEGGGHVSVADAEGHPSRCGARPGASDGRVADRHGHAVQRREAVGILPAHRPAESRLKT